MENLLAVYCDRNCEYCSEDGFCTRDAISIDEYGCADFEKRGSESANPEEADL